MTKKISKILIANRGEIAVRIMRTCREMGIATVAVYSEADRKALHVQMADEAYCIGPAPASASYLCVEKILDAAKKSGADAIHPGYGFLSEKAHFSAACEEAGVIFIGPTPAAIAAMGDKITARQIAAKAGVPTIPGTTEPIADFEKLKKTAVDFGYPVLLKATAGGGGKGMRVVHTEAELQPAFEAATREAEKAFGDGRMYLEKYILNPRHVEIQLACDTHGNGLFLLERECSLQRRHQKVIEEAPCFYLKDEVRQKMAKAALSLAKEVGYRGVGTIECLVDAEQDFYFLEMNTRLQVEHTVTEMITGIDLVRLQIDIANGEKLKLKQKDIAARGHAMECRIYAEDPANGFMPSPGQITYFRAPEGPGIRHDTGTYHGAEISSFYDPMISKLIVHAETRDAAIQKMQHALCEFQIAGVRHNIGFLQTLLHDATFCHGDAHTQYLDQHPELTQVVATNILADMIAAVVTHHEARVKKSVGTPNASTNPVSNWLSQGMREGLR